ncbi:unnamed protein product [Closterium sp. NIES-53]
MGVFGGVLAQLQRRPRETLTPQQLRAWLNVGRLGVVLAAQFGNAAELPHWLELLRQGVDIFALDYDAILSAITTLTPLSAPVPVRLADPSEGPVLARSSTVLPCPAVPSGSLPGLPLPSFSTNLGEDSDVLIPWIRTVRLQLRDRFREDLPVLRLHSDKCGSPQQNWIAERRIGLVMEVARTSMIHAAAPHFLWPFVVRYAAHQLNQWPHVSLPETLPTLGWTGKAGDPSVFGSGVLVPLFAIRLRTSSPPVLFPASSLAFPLTRLADSFITPPRAVSSPLRTSQPLGVVSTMAGREERGGRVAGGSGEAQAQGQPRDSAMAPMQPSLGPPRDEPRVFGLDKFNGDNFAEWSFKMENIFDHYDLLEVMEGTEKRPENDPEKSPWVRKSAQGYLLLGQALGSSQIRHIKPFQREPEKGPKAWAALKGARSCNSGGSGGVGTANGGTTN